MVSFADADYASKATDRRSVSRGVVMCGRAVSWYSKTQKCVTLSTTQAEYVAISDVAKEILFFEASLAFHVAEGRYACLLYTSDAADE